MIHSDAGTWVYGQCRHQCQCALVHSSVVVLHSVVLHTYTQFLRFLQGFCFRLACLVKLCFKNATKLKLSFFMCYLPIVRNHNEFIKAYFGSLKLMCQHHLITPLSVMIICKPKWEFFIHQNMTVAFLNQLNFAFICFQIIMKWRGLKQIWRKIVCEDYEEDLIQRWALPRSPARPLSILQL